MGISCFGGGFGGSCFGGGFGGSCFGGGFGGFGVRRLLIFLLVIATIFFLIGVC